MSQDQVDGHGPGNRLTSLWASWVRHSVAAALAGTLVAAAVVTTTRATAAEPASSRVPATPLSSVVTAFVPPRGAPAQVRAADGLSAGLVRSDQKAAAARLRLRILTYQSLTLLAKVRATSKAQVAAETDATAQSTRLVELGRQVQLARGALQQSAIDAYIGGGGPLGEMAVALESLTAPSPGRGTDPLATLNYRVNLRAHRFLQAQSERLAQVTTSARASSVSHRATAIAKTSAQAKSAHDSVIARELRLLAGLRAAQNAQVSRAAGVRSVLLRSATPAARAADRRLARILKGRDYRLLMHQSTRCGRGSLVYSNGWWPAKALCPLYAAPGQSLRRSAAGAFNTMSSAYQRQ
jgi:D-alanyl-D-alanine carboxypeptidase